MVKIEYEKAMIRNSKYLEYAREKADGVSLYIIDTQPIFELCAECEFFSVSYTGIFRYKERISGFSLYS